MNQVNLFQRVKLPKKIVNQNNKSSSAMDKGKLVSVFDGSRNSPLRLADARNFQANTTAVNSKLNTNRFDSPEETGEMSLDP